MVQVLQPSEEMTQAQRPRTRRGWNFARHFLEMCAAMCLAWVAAAIPFSLIASAAGYDDPVEQLPELALAVALVAMTAGMAAQMSYRRHERRCVVEMSAAMVVEAALLLGLAATGVIDRAQLFGWFHALMPVAMLVPMLLRREVYVQPVAGHRHDA